MKIKNTLALLLPFLFCAYSHAAVVVTIDITDPSAAVIRSVANNSLVNVNLGVNFLGGISFRNFFTANESIPITSPLAISGNWTARGTTSSYNEMVTFAFGDQDVVPGVDLSIYNGLAPDTDDQIFVTSAAPFTGSSTVDLSSFTNLPAVGATGDIYSGFLDSQGGLIGSWQIIIIPEPSTSLLGLVGILGILHRRRR